MSGASANLLVPAGSPQQMQALQELPLPTPVSYVPQTIGWVFVAAICLAAIGAALGVAVRRYRQQRYRRHALRELADLEAGLASAHADPLQRAAMLAAIARLLKRTSLEIGPRDHVAALTGDAWLRFLQRTRGRFDARTGRLLALVSYAPPEQIANISPDDETALIRHAREWIEHHHVEV